MSKDNIQFAFGLTPHKAIEFLKSKGAVLNQVDDVALLTSARQRAVRIAQLSSLEMTKDIYQSLAKAKAEGKAFGQWKAEIFEHFKRKGWVAGYDKGYLLADPKTGEYFGTPRRLDTIYRTNVQSAYSAQRYQQQMDNADNRPYWQYSAVGDSRTRPSHQALNRLVYRYDDPFWSVFYPPNGFNCRCSVIALAPRDIERRNLVVGNGSGRLVEYERRVNKTTTEKTMGFKLPGNQIAMADRGFDYNIGRTAYKPNLDNYPEKLAHQFAKQQMSGEVFKQDVKQLEQAFKQVKQELNLTDKLNTGALIAVRELLRKEYKFPAGVLNKTDKTALASETATVWLSDDTLVKQFNSRDDNFDVSDYAVLPDLINKPELITSTRTKHFQFFKLINRQKYSVILKVLGNEIFVQSFRKVSKREWDKTFNNR